MFLVTKEARMRYPKELLPPGADMFSCVFKEMPTPWFIVTSKFTSDGLDMLNTALTADFHQLKEILQSDTIADSSRVICMTFDYDVCSWLSHDIDEIWVENKSTKGVSGRLLLQDKTNSYFFLKGSRVEVAKPRQSFKNWTLLFGSKSQSE